jgi:hypothetical protein
VSRWVAFGSEGWMRLALEQTRTQDSMLVELSCCLSPRESIVTSTRRIGRENIRALTSRKILLLKVQFCLRVNREVAESLTCLGIGIDYEMFEQINCYMDGITFFLLTK